MNCDRARRDLMTEGRPADEGVRAHLESCTMCADFASRFEEARALLRDHRSQHQPDAHFATRVSAAASAESQLLGWAALRLLPATLALLLALSAWAWWSTPGPGSLTEMAPTDDLLAWAIEEAEAP